MSVVSTGQMDAVVPREDPVAVRLVGFPRPAARAWAAARGIELRERGWIDRFAGLLAPGATVLDIGCGSGEPIAVHLAGRGHPVTSVDSSPEMTGLFRANLPGQAAEVADMRRSAWTPRLAG